MRIYFQNAAGRLLEDPAGFLQAHWSPDSRTFTDLKALFTHMALCMQQRKWSRMLINQRGMLPFSQEEQRWVAEQWLPEAVRTAGYRFGAVVVSENVLTRLATAYITTHVQGLPLTYRSFESDEEAKAWLLNQPV
jgi:predicted anti-sigma-YlaC factor YlaD